MYHRQWRGRMDWKRLYNVSRNLLYHPRYSGIGKFNTFVCSFCELCICMFNTSNTQMCKYPHSVQHFTCVCADSLPCHVAQVMDNSLVIKTCVQLNGVQESVCKKPLVKEFELRTCWWIIYVVCHR